MDRIVPFNGQSATGAKTPKINIARWIKKTGVIYSVDGLQIKVDKGTGQLTVSHLGFKHIIANPFIIIHFKQDGDINSVEARTPIKGVIPLLLEPHKKVGVVKAILKATNAPPITQALLDRAAYHGRIFDQMLTLDLSSPPPPETSGINAEVARLIGVRTINLLQASVDNASIPPEKK